MTWASTSLIWLASFPKSGNTWARLLLANLLVDSEEAININDFKLNGGLGACRDRFEYLTQADASLLLPKEIEQLRPKVNDAYAASLTETAFCKIHDAYTNLADGTPVIGKAARAALYLVRDPRDVAVSYAYHCDCPLDHAVNLLDPAENVSKGGIDSRFLPQRLGNWSHHVSSWIDQRDLPVYLIRYEDLLADTEGTFKKALEFLDIQSSDADIARAVRHTSFSELSRQEKANGFKERVGSAPFFREGKVGSWRGKLSLDQVRAIESMHGEIMEKLGYQPER